MPSTSAQDSGIEAKATNFGRKIRLIIVLTIGVQMVRWVMNAAPPAMASAPKAIPPSAAGNSPASIVTPIAPTVAQAAAPTVATDQNWIATEGGIGPVSFGMAVDSAKRFFGPSFVAPADTSGRGCDRAFGPMLPLGVHLKVDNNRIVAANVDGPEFETSHHVRKGMTETEVRAAYPPPENSIVREGDANGYQLVVTPRADLPTYQFHFVFWRGLLQEFSVGNWALMPHWKNC